VPSPNKALAKGDYIYIVSSEVSFESQIYDVIYDTLDPTLINSVMIFGNISENITSSDTNVYYRVKNLNQEGSLLVGGIYNINLTSSDSVILLNPSSSMIISDGLKIGEINDSNRYIDISINENESRKIDVYNIDHISIDSIVKSLNTEFASELLPISAYRLDKRSGGSEILIASNVGSDLSYSFGIKISKSTDDAIYSLGFGYAEDKLIYGKKGTFYEINGVKYYEPLKKLNSSVLSFTSNLNIIDYIGTDSTFSFNDYNIAVGDFITILGDGYNFFLKISEILDRKLTVSSDQLPTGFPLSSVDGLIYIIYENTLNFSSFEFESVSSSFGSTIFEIFLSKENKLFYNPILEFETPVFADNAILNIVDFENPSDLTEATLKYKISEDDHPQVYFEDGFETTIKGDYNESIVRSSATGLTCKVLIANANSLKSLIAGGMTTSDIYFFGKADDLSNLKLANVTYNNFNSTIVGGANGFKAFSKLNIGTISSLDISNSFVKEVIEQKIDDLRANGVISGLEIYEADETDDGFFRFSVNAGFCYVSGKRFFIKKSESIITNIVAGGAGSDKVYIGIDHSGNIIYESCDIDCNYVWDDKEICLLGSLEYSTITQIIDMRLFIDEIDYKILNAITVSPRAGLAHFTDFVKAIKYAKRFSQIFPGAGTPEIILKSGEHEVTVDVTTSSTFAIFLFAVASQLSNTDQISFFDEHITNGIFIDFPVKISGEGTNSVLKIKTRHYAGDGSETIYGGYFLISGSNFNMTGDRSSKYHSRLELGDVIIQDLIITSGLDTSGITYNNSSLSIIDHVNFKFISTSPIVTGHRDSYIRLNRCSFENVFFSEISNIIYLKGNFSIENCLIKNSLNFYTSSIISRINNINVSNNSFLNKDGSICNITYEDLSVINPSRMITFFNNINYYRGSASADRNYDRTSNNLVVGGSLEVFEDLTVGDEIIFKTDKTMTKEIWIYKEMINSLLHKESILSYDGAFSPSTKYIYDMSEVNYAARTPFMDLPSGSLLDDVEERVKILDIDYDSGTRNRYMPAVIVYGSSSSLATSKLRFIIPVSDGQRISTINIYPGYPETLALSTDLIQMSIYKISHRGTTGYDAPILVAESLNFQLLGGGASANKKFSWDVEDLASGEPTLLVDTSEWSYLLEINNVYTSDIYLTRAVLKFKSKKLFELIGLK
jgi:hypothetical protein